MLFLVFRIKSGWFSWVKRACKAFVVSICESLKQGCDQQKRLAKCQSKFYKSLKHKKGLPSVKASFSLKQTKLAKCQSKFYKSLKQTKLAKCQSKFRQSLKQKLERNLLADTYLAHKG